MESFAFFIEAIFLALYTYGWRKLPPWFHFICGCIVVLSSWGSAAFITAVNGWMNTPQGFELLVDGEWLLKVENFRDLAALSPAMETTLQRVFPLEVILNPSFKYQVVHVILGSLGAVSFSLASIHAWMVLRGTRIEFHTRALQTVLPVAIITSIFLPVTGDLAARFLAQDQPIKLAAAEAHFETSSKAGLWIGGIPNEETRTVDWGIEILHYDRWLTRYRGRVRCCLRRPVAQRSCRAWSLSDHGWLWCHHALIGTDNPSCW